MRKGLTLVFAILIIFILTIIGISYFEMKNYPQTEIKVKTLEEQQVEYLRRMSISLEQISYELRRR